MKVEDRLQCHPRNLAEIIQAGLRDGDSENDLINLQELVCNLLVYDADARWNGVQVL